MMKKIHVVLLVCTSLLSACGGSTTDSVDNSVDNSVDDKLEINGDAMTSLALVAGSQAESLSTQDTPIEDLSHQDNSTPANSAQPWKSGVFEPDSSFKNKCSSPRLNVANPLTDNLYTDVQGTTLDEKNWLRSWNNDVYLWYNEVIDQNPKLHNGSPVDYFSTLKTQAITSSGKAKDEFHFTEPTAEFLNLSQTGIASGYGMTLTFISQTTPREIVIAYTQPHSPATHPLANLNRGTKILKVDGLDLVNTNDNSIIRQINAGLFPKTNGETHTFLVQDAGSDESRFVTMTSSEVTIQSVQNTEVIRTDLGNVGYMQFNEHIASSEQPLIEAINEFKSQEVTDLILDLRYNGGGLIYIATELASMIADTNTTIHQIFNKPTFNDKHQTVNPFTGLPISHFSFVNTTLAGELLPHLNLSRVFILTGNNTCSASELIINGLRGVDVEVIQIGSATCGKPYAFSPIDNCGTSYFTVNFKGVNAKGFGDYVDGFSPENDSQPFGIRLPGCAVEDDFTHPLGDVNESRLATALYYRETGECPNRSARSKQVKSPQKAMTVKPLWLQNAITP